MEAERSEKLIFLVVAGKPDQGQEQYLEKRTGKLKDLGFLCQWAEKTNTECGWEGWFTADSSQRNEVQAIRLRLLLEAQYRASINLKTPVQIPYEALQLHDCNQEELIRLLVKAHKPEWPPFAFEARNLVMLVEVGMEIARGNMEPLGVEILLFEGGKQTEIAGFDSEGVLHNWPPGLV